MEEKLRKLALGFPEATEGTSCTKAAYKVRKKNFLFVGEKDGVCTVMFKLKDSLEEAETMQKAEPEVYEVGSAGWVTARFKKAPKKGLLERWTEESYRLMAPKKLVATLD